MAFVKGKSGNPDGRPKGAANKATTALRDRTRQLLDIALTTWESDLAEMQPHERISVTLKLLEYHLPKLRAVEKQVSVDALTNDEVNAAIEKLLGND